MLTNWLLTFRWTPRTSINIQKVRGKTVRVPLLAKREMVVVCLSPKLSRLRSSWSVYRYTIQNFRKWGLSTFEVSSTYEQHSHFKINESVIKMTKDLNPSKALGPDELHPRVLKELGPMFAHLFQQSLNTGKIPKEWSLANICPLYNGLQSFTR